MLSFTILIFSTGFREWGQLVQHGYSQTQFGLLLRRNEKDSIRRIVFLLDILCWNCKRLLTNQDFLAKKGSLLYRNFGY